jgi:hypothetical protein
MTMVGRARERRNIVYRKLNLSTAAAKAWSNHLVSRMSSVLQRCVCVPFASIGALVACCAGVKVLHVL